MKTTSLKRQILIGVLVPLILGLSGLLYVSHRQAIHEIEEIFDAELAQTARMIAHFSLAHIDGSQPPTSTRPLQQDRHKYERHIAYQIWYRDALALRSDSAPSSPLAQREGFSRKLIDGRPWRVFGLHPPGSPYRIYTASDNEAREELSLQVTKASLKLFLWVLPLLAIAIYLSINLALKGLRQLSNRVREQDIDHLHALDASLVPAEIQPLVSALNELLQRLQDSMERERQFSAHASHELRTPLSNIRLYSQLAMKTRDPEQKQQLLEKVVQATDQSTHLVEQLLQLSRLTAACATLQRVDVRHLIEETTRHLQYLSRQKHIRLQLPDNELQLSTNAQLLQISMRNLLHNALHYSPAHSRIRIEAQAGPPAVIRIIDQGPGIAQERLEKVKQRFYRAANQDTEGCGLGLAIAEQAARSIGAELVLRNRSDGHSGLVAEIRFSQRNHKQNVE